MIIASSIVALGFGLILGLLLGNTSLLLLTSVLCFGLFWLSQIIRRQMRQSDGIRSTGLPISIFQSEFDDFEFTDDRNRLMRKKFISRAIGYAVGVLLGGVLAPVFSATL